jgi:hypothetical protein
VFFFRFDKAREQGLHRQAIDVAGVDAREQRFSEERRRFVAETTAHERADRFVVVSLAARHEELCAHAHLARPGEEPRFDERTDASRDAEDRRRRQRIQAPAALNVGDPRRLGRHESAAETEFLTERDRRGLLNQQRIRSAVEREAADFFADDHAAGARRLFEDDERAAPPRQLVGGGKARDPAADDRDVYRHLAIIVAAGRARYLRASR